MMSALPLSPRPRTLAAGMRAAGAMALAVLLASCSALGPSKDESSPNSSTGQADPSIAAAAPAGLQSFYSQKIIWQPCEDKMQCAKVKVPVDYAKPNGDTIELAAVKIASTGAKKGSLLVNPGGPGASGYDFVRDAGTSHFSETVRANYDLVGFDPRGVKRSAPVTCLTDKERDEARSKIYTPET